MYKDEISWSEIGSCIGELLKLYFYDRLQMIDWKIDRQIDGYIKTYNRPRYSQKLVVSLSLAWKGVYQICTSALTSSIYYIQCPHNALAFLWSLSYFFFNHANFITIKDPGLFLPNENTPVFFSLKYLI